MTAFVRSWLVMASVALLSQGIWAQDAQFEGFAPGWGAGNRAGQQRAYNGPSPDYELLPDDREPWDRFDEQLILNLKDVTADSWVKVEYLFGNFERPGNVLLGAPLAAVPNPRLPFNVQAGALVDAQAIVPDTSPLQIEGQNGVRTTIGINSFRDFSVEISYVGMQGMNSSFQRFPSALDPVAFPGAIRFYGTSLLNNGGLGSSVILYDRLFEASYSAHYWSGEVNVLLNNHTPNVGFRVRPSFGFRYNSFDDNLVQNGEFDNSSGVDPLLGVFAVPTRNTILSTAQNTFYMAQVGFQAELVDKWFTIGVAPRIAVGSNRIETHIMTSDLRDSLIAELANDGVTENSQSSLMVGANLDLNAYLTVRVNSWLSLTTSAYYWYMPNVARAYNTIVYDDLGIAVPPAIRSRSNTTSMQVSGFTVGAEIRF